MTSREIASAPSRRGTYRSGKISGLALYYLWLSGELMTHGRRGFERKYDLLENVAPAEYQYRASVEEAENYFALRVFDYAGMVSAKGWRNMFAGTVERRVSQEEAAERLDALTRAGSIFTAAVREDNRRRRGGGADSGETITYAKAAHLPLIETLANGAVPDEWQPLRPSEPEEMIFLAPLEMVTARGRALPLFGFEYIWEVYKPVEKRRWGYYTLPVLYGDLLVARFDARMERETRTFVLKNFWLENGVRPDHRFLEALRAGFQRFCRFAGAENSSAEASVPAEIAALLAQTKAEE